MSSEPSHPVPPGPPPAIHDAPIQKSPVPVATSVVGMQASDTLIVYRHSNFFYWWPVWLIGFIFAIITYIDNNHLAIVPPNTVAVEGVEIDIKKDGTRVARNVLVLEQGKSHWKQKNEAGEDEIIQPIVYVTHHRALGSIYAIVLLMVITITSISMRGLWTVLFMVAFIMVIFILSAAGWWGSIFHKLNQLSIYINMGGYILISSVLFILWMVNFFLLDRQTYMIFMPGQVRVRLEIGGEETSYDTTGMVVQRERGDFFRHWVLGFGSGDLIIKPVGVAHPLQFPNVLRVGAVAEVIEQMVKEKVIVRSPAQHHSPA